MAQYKSPAENLHDFDPNDKRHVPWATWITRDGFKVHTQRASALIRYGNHPFAVIYAMGDDGRWHAAATKCPPDEYETCHICSGTTRRPVGHPEVGWKSRRVGNDEYDTGLYFFERLHGRILSPLIQKFACPECYTRFA